MMSQTEADLIRENADLRAKLEVEELQSKCNWALYKDEEAKADQLRAKLEAAERTIQMWEAATRRAANDAKVHYIGANTASAIETEMAEQRTRLAVALEEMRDIARVFRGIMRPEDQNANPKLLTRFFDAFHGCNTTTILAERDREVRRKALEEFSEGYGNGLVPVRDAVRAALRRLAEGRA